MEMMTMKENGKKPVTSWDLGVAMRRIYDDMDSALVPGILLGDMVYQIKEWKRDGFSEYALVDKVEWGLPKRYLTAEVKSLFETWGYRKVDGGYEYEVQGVPVKLKIIERRYKFFENPDQVFYGVDEFRIPNPYQKYLKSRYIIK